MAQDRTELAVSTRVETEDDDVERDRIAWNLPLSALDEASRRADGPDPDAPTTPELDERSQ